MVRILVNGCSHTAADIPDNPEGDPWPKILCDKIDADLINLALPSKDNTWILEETIRYLINDDNINHIIIYLTDWSRLNVYNIRKSFTWVPGEIETQFGRLRKNYNRNEVTVRDYVRLHRRGKLFGGEEGNKSIGDKSQIFEIITIGTLTNCLYQICKSKNIGLTIINLAPIGDSKDDKVWTEIPNDLFLFSNNKLSSIFYHFYGKYGNPDLGHFEHSFHYELADHVEAHYRNKTQIIGITEKPRINLVYDYT